MGDFELDIELLISLVETRPVLWDKREDMYKTKRKRHGQKFVFVFQKALKF